MKQTRLNRTLSLLLALVLCAGMVPATAVPAAAAQSGEPGMAVVSTDDFSSYEVGSDTLWQHANYTGFYEAYHNAPGNPSYATYGIAQDGDNKVMALTSVNETPNYFHTGTTLTGQRGFTVDINFQRPDGASVPGLVLNPMEGQTYANGGVLVYVEAQGDVKFRGDLNGTLEQILVTNALGEPLRPAYGTWYTLKVTVSLGQMVLKMWPKGGAEPADTATAGVAVYRSDKIDAGILAGQSQLRIMTRNRNRPGEAYTTWLDNLTLSAAVQLNLTDIVIGMGGGQLIPPMPITQQLAPVPEDDCDMITTAENVARMYCITRQECDEFAYRSQMRAAAATEKGYFKEEIVPVVIPATRKTPKIVYASDEFLRPSTTMEGLAALRSMQPGGVTTAGNASGRNDGAAMVLLMSEEKAAELGYTPYARFVMAGNAALDPKVMGLGPVNASLDALKKAGLTIADIDVWECNEAFAAQNLGVIRGLEQATGCTIDQNKWNPNGGAISFGHPNGASGGRVCQFAMRELERSGGKYGLFTSCCGGGLGVTTIIENLRR